MHFVSSFKPPEHLTDSDIWFVVRNDQVLVKNQNGRNVFPAYGDLSGGPNHFSRRIFIGTLDDRPCYAAISNGDRDMGDNLIFKGLRSLFSEIDEAEFQAAGVARQLSEWDQVHQYCGRCGALVQDKPDERAKICPICGLVIYPRISPAIITAVIKNDRILLARSHRFKGSYHSVLAGFVEIGETLEDCVRREVKEEVGIEIANIRYFGSQPWPFPNSLMIGFVADYLRGEIIVDGVEIADADWFHRDCLPDIPGKMSIARKLIDGFVAGAPLF